MRCLLFSSKNICICCWLKSCLLNRDICYSGMSVVEVLMYTKICKYYHLLRSKKIAYLKIMNISIFLFFSFWGEGRGGVVIELLISKQKINDIMFFYHIDAQLYLKWFRKYKLLACFMRGNFLLKLKKSIYCSRSFCSFLNQLISIKFINKLNNLTWMLIHYYFLNNIIH